MEKKVLRLFFFSILAIIFFSCQEEIEKYEQPEWLKGKLYTQIKATEDLDSFAVSLNLSGLDTIINVSGSYTVFAPTNQAFQNFFQQSSLYEQISDIPIPELLKIVKYHIVQNSWNLGQLMALDVYGWIDQSDPNNNKPRGYKRQTVLKDENKKYWVKKEQGEYTIIDSIYTDQYRVVNTSSRKYVPFFFDGFLSVAGITGSDYDFFFESGYFSGTMHFAGSHVISSEIYAENGIVYKIDEVISPLKNAEELLKQEYSSYSYSDFLTMIYKYGKLTTNMEETMKLPGFKEGLDVDTLYDLTFPDLTFNVTDELTGPSNAPSTFTIRYHNGIIAPTNEALDDLFSQVIMGPNHWQNIDAVPSSIYQIIINSHMSNNPIYLVDFTKGFKNGENDLVFIDPSSVIQADYSSNSTFIGVNKAIIPRAFSSVAGPVYLRPDYSIYRSAMELTNVLSTIKRENENYLLFVVPDVTLSQDSSLMLNPDPRNPKIIKLRTFDRGEKKFIDRSKTEMVIQLFNQIGATKPSGTGRKEFIPNLAGNYIVFDWENGIVTGGVSSVLGYRGDSVIYLSPEVLDEPTDNGLTYNVNGWFSFPQTSLYTLIANYSEFNKLLQNADLLDNVFYRLKFITSGELYTIFIPSDEALKNFDTSQMTKEELQQFIKYHFIRGEIIFTDGKKPYQDYSTLRIDESSTTYNTKYSKLNLKPGINIIDILNPDGTIYYRINEQSGTSNIMVAEDIDASISMNYITTGVIHVIDTVLVK